MKITLSGHCPQRKFFDTQLPEMLPKELKLKVDTSEGIMWEIRHRGFRGKCVMTMWARGVFPEARMFMYVKDAKWVELAKKIGEAYEALGEDEITIRIPDA